MSSQYDRSSFNMKWERALCLTMLGMTLVLFLIQARSLFIFPQPNSLRWFGDETWLMSEAKTQITTGVVRYPLAVGSTLEHSKGLVLSMTWLSSVLYGLPATLFSASPVAVGRIVTAVISLLLLITLYASARSLGASHFSSAAAVLLLVSSRSFFFASHSCRPDILAGLILVGFVTIGTKLSRTTPKNTAWWFAFGCIVMFLAVSSSIHLLTLLLPVSIYFIWNTKSSSQINRWVGSATGAVTVLGILILIYYITTGDITLFSHSSGPAQFNDVLSSIPILRPFSRSVQIANIIIRIKQFAAEAPQSFLLIPLLPLFMMRSQRSTEAHTFCIASIIVFLSWFLLQGAEITYLIQILPLIMLGLAIAISHLLEQAKFRLVGMPLLLITTIIFFILSFHDVTKALGTAEALDHSNQSAVSNITLEIARTWNQPSTPRVVTEPPTLDRLSISTNIQTITDHFISFPQRQEPFDSFFAREHIDYVVLYNSPTYPKDRSRADPFYQAVRNTGTLIDEEIGTTGDIGRTYFRDSPWKDTLLLFKLHTAR